MLPNALTNHELARVLEESDDPLCQEAAKRLWAVEKPADVSVKEKIKAAVENLADLRGSIDCIDSEIRDVECDLELIIKDEE